jgi:hypothetical protein
MSPFLGQKEAAASIYDEETFLPIDPVSGMLVEPESGRLMTRDEALASLGIPGESAAAAVIFLAIGGFLLDVTGVLDDIVGAL